MRAGTQASDRDRDPDPHPDQNGVALDRDGDPDRPIRIAIPKILCRVNGRGKNVKNRHGRISAKRASPIE